MWHLLLSQPPILYTERILSRFVLFEVIRILFQPAPFAGDASRFVKGIFLPTIGLHKPGESVRVNFGASKFQFDIDKMRSNFKAEKAADIAQIPSPPIDALISQYLLHHGYLDTLATFDKYRLAASSGDAKDTSAKLESDPTRQHRKGTFKFQVCLLIP